MLAGGLVLVGHAAALTGEFGRPSTSPASRRSRSRRSLYLTVVGSLIAFTTYGWLLRKAPLPLIATYAYVNPVVAVILGASSSRSRSSRGRVIAGAIIVFAVALIVTARGRMQRPAAAAAAASRAPSRGDRAPEARLTLTSR